MLWFNLSHLVGVCPWDVAFTMVSYFPPFRWDRRLEWGCSLIPVLPAGETGSLFLLEQPFVVENTVGLCHYCYSPTSLAETWRHFRDSSLWESGAVTEDINHRSVGTLLRLQPWGIFHSHASSQLSFRNSSKSSFKHSYQFIAPASSNPGKQTPPPTFFIYQSLQILMSQFVLWPQFSD